MSVGFHPVGFERECEGPFAEPQLRTAVEDDEQAR